MKLFDSIHYLKTIISCVVLGITLSAHAQTCAIPGLNGAGVVAGVVNTYFPPSTAGTFSAGSSNIPLSASTGAAAALASGDLLLVVQMQCANVNTTNTANYGAANGTGRGYTDPVSSCAAGQYEYVRAGAGSTSANLVLNPPLVNTYIQDPPTATNRRTFQIIRVPQYASATLSGAITAPSWNGTSGGVVVLDVAGQLNWSGQTINAAGRGFRGGGGINWPGTTDTDTPPDWVDALANAVHAVKGEGIAGTPRWVYDTVNNVRTDLGATWGGYAGGDVGRGAPGNAGGGGNNRNGGRDNGGGGGGGNGGIGGFGAYGWKAGGWANTVTAADFDLRGIGGAAFAAPAANRVVMGGGGGAGATNNSGNPPGLGIVDGGSGGGIVIVRAGSMIGNGTVNVAGSNAITNPNNDAAGGGGAAGSVVLMSAAGAVGATVNIVANGGAGASSFLGGGSAHGGGGGGSGGVVITSGLPAVNIAGGNNGLTNTADAPVNASHGATAGAAGNSATNQADSSFSTSSGALCLPNLTVSKIALSSTISTAGATTVGYEISISNSGGTAIGSDIVDNALAPGWTFASSSAITFSPALSATGFGGFVESATPGIPAVANSPGSVANLAINGSPTDAPAWSNIAIPGVTNGQAGRVTLSFVVNIPATAPVGCYHNPAGVKYIDPTRSTAGREITPLINNTANRAGSQVGGTANTSYETAPGVSTIVGGSNYSGLDTGPSGEDVCLQGDLSITKSNPGSITPGQTISYTLVASNLGRQIRDLSYAADQATSANNASSSSRILSDGTVRVIDTLPTGMTLAGTVTATGWACSVAGSTLTCDRSTTPVPLAASTPLSSITIPVRVSNSACPNPVTNTATVSSFQAPYTETSIGNNSQSVASPLVCNANLSVSKSNGLTTTQAGTTTQYTITFSNAGPSSADGANISDTASPGLSSCSVQSCTPSGSAVCPSSFANFFSGTVPIPSLPSGGQLSVIVQCGVSATGL